MSDIPSDVMVDTPSSNPVYAPAFIPPPVPINAPTHHNKQELVAPPPTQPSAMPACNNECRASKSERCGSQAL